ncbi:hypothetical protein [Parafrankia sp. EUN1f]|uniref:hypothetical protein n=1 Tax=Parafrankia sp. EUN1f TaxID=102897 RepID=UPI0001C47469|nr:hypothetical protein [Parafrankia sp. EUN1f]EFC80101.1 hypothetical protein FrEUN1fDRAFT_6786 [Parafrankia sp. EUN1f]
MTNEMLSARAPYHYRAPYIEAAKFREVENLCLRELDPEILQHVSYYTEGVLGLSFDVLEQADLPATSRRSAGTGRRRRDLESFGRQINRAVEELNRVLEPLDTGVLIRVVFDAGIGGLIYNRVNTRQYLIGAALHPEGLAAADVTMSKLATRCRSLLGLPGQNPGGIDSDTQGPPSGSHITPPLVGLSPDADPEDIRFSELGRHAVRPDDLHYAARCKDNGVNVVVDVFDAPALGSFFLTVGVKRHRDLYETICRDLSTLTANFARAARAALGTPLRTSVVDVEAGALYVHDVGAGEYLLGVTLDQQRVSDAERRFRDLVTRFLDSR